MDRGESLALLFNQYPHLADALEAILAVDRQMEAWDVADVPVERGMLCELVAHGIVDRTDAGYRVAEPARARRLLDAGMEVAADGGTLEGDSEGLSAKVEQATPSLAVGASLLAVGLVTLLSRAYIYGSVFRHGDVVLLSNDPWGKRYMVEQFTAQAAGAFDVGILASFSARDYLMVATLGWVAELLGGDPYTVGVVLAWYPVVAALVTVGLIYLIARRVTGDHWIGITAAVMLAITPVHAFRTALGFADHHAFDHPWLALTVLCLIWLADTERGARSRRIWLVGSLLGVAVAGQTLAWLGGPLLTIPIGIYAAVRVLSDVRADHSPLTANAPMVVGLAIGSGLVWLAHLELGWHPFAIALHPTVLTAGVLGVLVLGAVAYRWNVSPLIFGIAEFVSLVGIVSLVLAISDVSLLVSKGLEYFARTTGRGIAESMSLIGGPFGVVTGPLSLFGLLLFLAVPYLVVATRATYREHSPAWLVVVVYAWYFTVFALVQRRFAAQLALFVAPFAAIGLFDIAARTGVIHDFELFDPIGTEYRIRLELAISRGITTLQRNRENLPTFLGTISVFILAEGFILAKFGEVSLIIHGIGMAILIYLIYNTDGPAAMLYQSLLLVPVLRIFNLGMPIVTENSLYSLGVLYSVLLLSVIVILRSQELSREELGLSLNGLPLAVLGLGIGLALGVVQYGLSSEEFTFLHTPVNYVLFILSVGLLVGFVEETIFRGLIQRWAAELFDTWLAILATSVLFGFMQSVWLAPSGIVFAGVVSAFLGWIYVRTDNLWLIASIHGMINVSAFLLAPLFLPNLGVNLIIF